MDVVRRRLRVLLGFVLLTSLFTACAHTSDDTAIAQRDASIWSPIRNDADDATAALAAGWRPPAGDDQVAGIEQHADVTLTVARAGAFDAVLDAAAFQRPRRMQVYVDGKPIAPPVLLSVEGGAPIVLPIGTLGFGQHQIRFESLDGSESAPGNPLSIRVHRLTMERVGG